jgi:hypothetical protein
VIVPGRKDCAEQREKEPGEQEAGKRAGNHRNDCTAHIRNTGLRNATYGKLDGNGLVLIPFNRIALA